MDNVIVEPEIVRTLQEAVDHYGSVPFQIGLFTNNVTVGTGLVIGDITPASGGGYSGLQDLDSWGSVVWDTDHAIGQHDPVVWTFDGSSTQTIRGWYVVDGSGALRWVAKRTDSGQVVGSFPGQTYTAFPFRKRKNP